MTAPILAQSLGVEGRGQLAALMQPLTVADSLAALGIPTATAFYVARGADVRRMQFRGYAGALLTGVVAFGVLAAYSFNVAQSQGISQPLLALLWMSVIPGALLAVRRSAWTGLQRWKRVDLERTAFAGSRLLIILMLAVFGLGEVMPFAAGPIIVGLLISSALLIPKFHPTPQIADYDAAPAKKDFYRFSIYAAFGTVSASASARLDQALMPSLTSSEQLGLYAVAVTVAEVPLLVGTVLARNLMSEASAGEPLKKMLRQILLGAGVAVVGSVILGALASWVVPLIFGASFRDSLAPIYLLLLSTCMSVLTISFSAVLTGWHRPLLASVPQVMSVVAVICGFGAIGQGISAVETAIIAVAAQTIAFAASCLLIGLMRPSTGRHRRTRE
ncbi:oligosaccharide flippase family protein [Arthrobacter sp. NicSoilB11]|uniref:oligosaccharide flippase family protein n=1 Tax=Arthrobacter sp. NicSoilB11 TaxID=2830999 RepID=UPI0021E1A0F1|nr:oligosaccharide flippase family protein [Arthrobacter sp. NicSoilB11]